MRPIIHQKAAEKEVVEKREKMGLFFGPRDELGSKYRLRNVMGGKEIGVRHESIARRTGDRRKRGLLLNNSFLS